MSGHHEKGQRFEWRFRPSPDAELIAFINNDEAVRPDGTRGPGLFAYLRALMGADGGDRRDVIATVFRGTINCMINGYLLRDVVNKINSINFTSTEEIHTLSHLYESMVKEMRDTAGDSGEFYTPRPVVRFIVDVMDPQLGETVLDPACGTGGFLAETYEHLLKQVKTTGNREILQRESIYGGEEERGILGNFPEDMQTSETALLFLQLINAWKVSADDVGKNNYNLDIKNPNRAKAHRCKN